MRREGRKEKTFSPTFPSKNSNRRLFYKNFLWSNFYNPSAKGVHTIPKGLSRSYSGRFLGRFGVYTPVLGCRVPQFFECLDEVLRGGLIAAKSIFRFFAARGCSLG